ncbi:MAG: tryptophan synthase subunit alpha [Gammaproteobacteria bacterium]|nr:tryptophan synthase subunit alpha [Gammaproteobacteria bacterium]
MSRLSKRFDALRVNGRKALIPYITAGDPLPWVTVPLMHAMVNSGADVIELGVPFSDPMADGPVIQAACERALKNKITLKKVLAMVAEFRQKDHNTPVVLMGYLNPVEVMGYETFAKAAAEAGVDGVLTVDMPPEEAQEFVPIMRSHGLDSIFLMAPNSTPERMRKVAEIAQGFVYYVSFKGVTGANSLDTTEVATKVAELRKHISLPIGVGFGIRDAQSAAAVSRVADAVVVGSALVSRIGEDVKVPDRVLVRVPQFLKELRMAIDKANS